MQVMIQTRFYTFGSADQQSGVTNGVTMGRSDVGVGQQVHGSCARALAHWELSELGSGVQELGLG